MMENTLVGVLVVIFVSSRFSSAEYTSSIKSAHFQLSQKHPDLKKCTIALLSEDEYVGGRVSERTGECEGLSYAWGLNPTIESGYAYAKKVFVQEVFQPPLKVDRLTTWNVPVVLQTGTKLNMFISIPNPGSYGRREEFELLGTYMYYFQMRLWRYEANLSGPLRIEEYIDLPASFRSRNPFKIKISFLALDDSVMILVDDKELTTFYLKKHLKNARLFKCRKTRPDLEVPAGGRTDYLFIDRIQYEEN